MSLYRVSRVWTGSNDNVSKVDSSYLQRLELTPLPLGLIEEETEEDPDDDTITAEPVRHQPCAPKISRIDQDELTPVVSRDADVHHRGGVAVLRLTDYQPPPELTPSVASTTELIPTSCSLSSFAATAESSGHLPAWLDNASLMVIYCFVNLTYSTTP